MNACPTLNPAGLVQRELTIADLPAALALHLECTQGLTNELVRKESLESMQALLGRGSIIGLFDLQKLVAYGVLLLDLLDNERLPAHIATDSQRPQAVLSGVTVSPTWRGHGLQRRLIMLRVAMAPANALLSSTAAPANWYSWNNLLDCGFHVRAITQCYGGHTRYLMVQEPLPSHALYPDLSKEFHALDLKRQHDLIEQDWRGAQPGHSPEFLRYVPVSRSRA